MPNFCSFFHSVTRLYPNNLAALVMLPRVCRRASNNLISLSLLVRGQRLID